MKNLEDNFSQNIQPSLERLDLEVKNMYGLFDGLLLNCKGNNPAYLYCSEEGCQEDAVLCKNQECKCQADHLDCQFLMKMYKFHQKINNKVIGATTETIQQIDQEVKNITNRVSQMLDEFNEMFKIFGLNKSDQTIRQKINEHFTNKKQDLGTKKLTGNDIFYYRKSSKQAINDWIDYSYEKYSMLLKQTQSQIFSLFQKIWSSLIQLHNTYRPNGSLQNYFLRSKILLKHNKVYQKDSQFKSTKSQLFQNKTINPFFVHTGMAYLLETLQKQMKINSFKRIYTYDLELSQSCNKETLIKTLENKQNLLILVKNKSNDIYAAFVPIKLAKQQEISQLQQKIKERSTIIFRLQGNYCEKPSGERNAFIIRKDLSCLQIGEVFTIQNDLQSKRTKLTINFCNNYIQVQQSMKNNCLQQTREIQTKDRSTIVNLEVYEIFLDRFLMNQTQQIQVDSQQQSRKKRKDKKKKRVL